MHRQTSEGKQQCSVHTRMPVSSSKDIRHKHRLHHWGYSVTKVKTYSSPKVTANTDKSVVTGLLCAQGCCAHMLVVLTELLCADPAKTRGQYKVLTNMPQIFV